MELSRLHIGGFIYDKRKNCCNNKNTDVDQRMWEWGIIMKLSKKISRTKFSTSFLCLLGSILIGYILCTILLNPRVHLRLTQPIYRMILILTSILYLFVIIFLIVTIYQPMIHLSKQLKKIIHDYSFTSSDFDGSIQSLADFIFELVDEMKLSIEREHSEIVLRQQAEYAQLQSQINPHFLYNTLESLRGQAITYDNYQIADMAETLARYFRYNINKDSNEVTLGQELENVRNYINIQKYRFQDKFDFHIYNHDESRRCLKCMIPKMTLQPIVENAIDHGMKDQVEKGEISIHIEMTEKKIDYHCFG